MSESLFDQFWTAYPRHEVKSRARKAFEKINPDDDLLREMLQWIEAAKYSEQWSTVKYIPHPATWLNGRYWEGDVPPIKVTDTVGSAPEDETEMTPEYRALIEARAKGYDL
jgi:hypothetical protein